MALPSGGGSPPAGMKAPKPKIVIDGLVAVKRASGRSLGPVVHRWGILVEAESLLLCRGARIPGPGAKPIPRCGEQSALAA